MDEPEVLDRRDPTSLDSLLRQTRSDEAGCLLWTGGICGAGLPIFKRGTHSFRVARRVFLAVHGKPEKGHWVVEPQCGNLRCIAPEHLRAVPRSQAIRRLVGVPLPDGETLKSAGYALVHRVKGASIWEPLDIAKAIWSAQGIKSCHVCGTYIGRRGQLVCGRACENRRDVAKRRVASGTAEPEDVAMVRAPGLRPMTASGRALSLDALEQAGR